MKYELRKSTGSKTLEGTTFFRNVQALKIRENFPIKCLHAKSPVNFTHQNFTLNIPMIKKRNIPFHFHFFSMGNVTIIIQHSTLISAASVRIRNNIALSGGHHFSHLATGNWIVCLQTARNTST